MTEQVGGLFAQRKVLQHRQRLIAGSTGATAAGAATTRAGVLRIRRALDGPVGGQLASGQRHSCSGNPEGTKQERRSLGPRMMMGRDASEGLGSAVTRQSLLPITLPMGSVPCAEGKPELGIRPRDAAVVTDQRRNARLLLTAIGCAQAHAADCVVHTRRLRNAAQTHSARTAVDAASSH